MNPKFKDFIEKNKDTCVLLGVYFTILVAIALLKIIFK